MAFRLLSAARRNRAEIKNKERESKPSVFFHSHLRSWKTRRPWGRISGKLGPWSQTSSVNSRDAKSLMACTAVFVSHILLFKILVVVALNVDSTSSFYFRLHGKHATGMSSNADSRSQYSVAICEFIKISPKMCCNWYRI